MSTSISVTGTVLNPSVSATSYTDPAGSYQISNNTTDVPQLALNYTATTTTPNGSASIAAGGSATFTTNITNDGTMVVGNNPNSHTDPGNVTFTLRKSPRL